MPPVKLSVAQRFLLKWMAESPTGGICRTSKVPADAPLGVTMMALRGLERRGLVEDRNDLFYITDAGRAAITVKP